MELGGGGCVRNTLAVVIKVKCMPLKLILTHLHKTYFHTTNLHKPELTFAVLVLT